ncbi:MAG: enoyl-CoA hydratase/isomerase family protein [Acidimicrobiales bacterium]
MTATDATPELVTYEREGAIVILRLNRPDKLNAFSDELVIALRDAFRRFDADAAAHVAVLCGNGRAFSTGADVQQRQLRSREEFIALGGPQGHGAKAGELFLDSVNWKPVITAVHGYVMGLATGIMLDSDLVVAEAGTSMQITEVSRGLGGSRYWAIMQFRGAAAFGTEMALTGRFFSAEEAFEHGLINRLVEPGQALDAALALAREVDRNPPLSVRATVRSRRYYLGQLAREMEMQAAPLKLYLTEDFQEAARSFAEKREPRPFQGR